MDNGEYEKYIHTFNPVNYNPEEWVLLAKNASMKYICFTTKHHEYGYNPNFSHQWKSVNKDKPDTIKYREYVKNQITELLTNYGKIYTFFWDIPPATEDRCINELVRNLQPGIYINNRGYDEGDFATPERELDDVSGIKHFGKMTEACNSVGEQSWGTEKIRYTNVF